MYLVWLRSWWEQILNWMNLALNENLFLVCFGRWILLPLIYATLSLVNGARDILIVSSHEKDLQVASCLLAFFTYTLAELSEHLRNSCHLRPGNLRDIHRSTQQENLRSQCDPMRASKIGQKPVIEIQHEPVRSYEKKWYTWTIRILKKPVIS